MHCCLESSLGFKSEGAGLHPDVSADGHLPGATRIGILSFISRVKVSTSISGAPVVVERRFHLENGAPRFEQPVSSHTIARHSQSGYAA